MVHSLPGVTQADASYQEGKAIAEFDPQQVSPEEIAQAIDERTYYRATVLSVSDGPFTPLASAASRPQTPARAIIFVEGMTSDLAAGQAMAAMGRPGIGDVSVDLRRSQLTVVFDASQVPLSWFIDSINNLTPFKARLLEVTQPRGDSGGLNPVWIAVAAAGAVGGGILAWYGLTSARRRPLAADSQRRKRKKHR